MVMLKRTCSSELIAGVFLEKREYLPLTPKLYQNQLCSVTAAEQSLCVYLHWLCYVACVLCCSSSSPDPSIADTQDFLCLLPTSVCSHSSLHISLPFLRYLP